MPDPFRRVRPGDDLVIPAPTYNAMVDAAEAEQRRRLDGGDPGRSQLRRADIVRVLNDTGKTLDARSVVGLDGPVIGTEDLNAFLAEVTFRGKVPDTSSPWRFAITLEPAAPNQVVRAYLAGVCQVKVDVRDQTHAFARVIDGEAGHLQSANTGPVEILWAEEEGGYAYGYGGGYSTGVQWCYIRFGGNDPGPRYARTTSILTAASGATLGQGTIRLVERTGAHLDDDPAAPDDQVCYNKGGEVSAGRYIEVDWCDGAWSVTVDMCDADAYA